MGWLRRVKSCQDTYIMEVENCFPQLPSDPTHAHTYKISEHLNELFKMFKYELRFNSKFKKCIFSHKASDEIDIVTWIPFKLEVLRQYSKLDFLVLREKCLLEKFLLLTVFFKSHRSWSGIQFKLQKAKNGSNFSSAFKIFVNHICKCAVSFPYTDRLAWKQLHVDVIWQLWNQQQGRW